MHRITRTFMVLVLATLAVSALAVDVKLNGYVQVRYTDVLGTPTGSKDAVSGFQRDSTFVIRRARLSAKAAITPATQAVIEIDASKSAVETKKAYIAHTFKRYGIVAGRTSIPFSYEVPLSSSALVTLERSMISGKLPEYVTGVLITPDKTVLPVKATVGIVNGNDPTSLTNSGNGNNNGFLDTNQNKAVVINVDKVVNPNLTVGASFMTDNDGADAANVHVIAKHQQFGLVGEYTATDFDSALAVDSVRNKGYYVLATYAMKPTTTLYARYDSLDAAGSAAAKHRLTLGTNLLLDADNTKLTVEYQTIDNPNDADVNGALGVQLQTKF